MRIGLRGVAYAFDGLRDIETLSALAADPAALAAYRKGGHRQFGYSSCTLSEQAVSSARQTLAIAGLPVAKLDALVVGSASIRFWPKYSEQLAAEILTGLEITGVPFFGVTLGGCANFSHSLRVARALMNDNGWRNVLVIETNKMPNDEMRPYMPYVSIFGDASVSVIVSADDSDFQLVSVAHVSKPLPNAVVGDPRFLANNIAGYRHVIGDALRSAQCDRGDVDVVIPNNKNVAELARLASFWGLPFEKVFTGNVGRIGHLWSGDNLINLKDFCSEPDNDGQRIFLLLSQGDTTYSAIILHRQ